jgi:hypothetical protein
MNKDIANCWGRPIESQRLSEDYLLLSWCRESDTNYPEHPEGAKDLAANPHGLWMARRSPFALERI